jgi:hypothetical protein
VLSGQSDRSLLSWQSNGGVLEQRVSHSLSRTQSRRIAVTALAAAVLGSTIAVLAAQRRR